jgi:hypothetical protein
MSVALARTGGSSVQRRVRIQNQKYRHLRSSTKDVRCAQLYYDKHSGGSDHKQLIMVASRSGMRGEGKAGSKEEGKGRERNGRKRGGDGRQ